MRRRAFLAAGGVAVLFTAGCSLPVIPSRPAPDAQRARSWVRHVDGRYELFLPRMEMGQNVSLALAQVAAEELGIDPAALRVRLPATTDIAAVRATVGSESIRDFALPLAQACAVLREAVARGRSGELLLENEPVPPLRAFAPGGRWVGRDLPLPQAAAIVRGEPLYAADVRLPGMRYGRVLHAPASPELRSLVLSLDEAAARVVPGFVALVRDPLLALGQAEGVGIVAATPGALDRIEAALAVRWDVQGSLEQADLDRAMDIDARLAGGRLAHSLAKGDVGAGPWQVDLRLDIPAASHGAIQPRAAVAAPAAEGGVQVWAGTQDLFYVRDVIARRLDVKAEKVVVQACRIGGAFGGRTICTVELEAAVLARAAAAPVKVQWTRGQELRQAFHRPPSSHRIRARVENGRLAAWWHGFASSHIFFTNAVLPPWLRPAVDLLGDDGVARGARLPYRCERQRIEYDAVRVPVLTGPWRGLGAGPNATAIECAMDECARVARADPLAFRLQHAQDPRLARVLRAVAEAARWEQRPASAGEVHRGRGIAGGIYKDSSYAAVVADVEVARDGRVRVSRLWCAHDCGRVVHPGQVRAQCEGNLVWGLGMVFTDRLPVGHGGIAAASFAAAPIPRLADVPPLEVVLVDHGEPPSGAGETAIVAAAAAVLNAIRDATGVRVSRLPLVDGAVPA